MSALRSLGALAALLAACSSATEESTGAARSAVVAGTDSDASQDAVVFIIHKDPLNPRVGMCTGSLVAPNLVLTARHCVADADASADCAADGSPGTGGAVGRNHDPSTVLVYAGKKRPPFASQSDLVPTGVGAQILDDGADNLCNHDIALIVLKDPLVGVPILPMRLDGAVTKNETFTAVGWGITTTSTKPAVRQQRAGVRIVAVGPDATTTVPVPPNLFAASEAICLGDSGGPAIATTGAIIGVVTGGGNGQQPTASNPAAPCVGDATLNLYTRLAPFKNVIAKGFALAGAEPWVEGGPDPRLLKTGSACVDGSECRSNLCLPDPDQKASSTCAEDCTASSCPEGTVCNMEGGRALCHVPKSGSPNEGTASSTTNGCAGAPVAPSRGDLAVVALAALGAVVGRRRRA